MDKFQLLPDDQGWQDTIHFKDEGHRCSILKRWVPSCTYFLRNLLRDFRELLQRGRHIQLMELPILSICWLSDYSQCPNLNKIEKTEKKQEKLAQYILACRIKTYRRNKIYPSPSFLTQPFAKLSTFRTRSVNILFKYKKITKIGFCSIFIVPAQSALKYHFASIS